jgi:hypothetical protein
MSYFNSDRSDPQLARPVPLRTQAPTAPTSWLFPTQILSLNQTLAAYPSLGT